MKEGHIESWEIKAFRESALNPDKQKEFLDHLDQCEECREKYSNSELFDKEMLEDLEDVFKGFINLSIDLAKYKKAQNLN